MSTPTSNDNIELLVTQLKTLRLQQAQELHVLLHNCQQQETRLMLRLEHASINRQYHNAATSSAYDDSLIEEVSQPPTTVTILKR